MAEPSVSRRKVAGLEAGNPYAGTRKSRTAKESAVSSNSASLRAPREEAVELDGRKQNHTCEPPPHTSQPRSTHLSIDTLARPVTSHSSEPEPHTTPTFRITTPHNFFHCNFRRTKSLHSHGGVGFAEADSIDDAEVLSKLVALAAPMLLDATWPSG